MTAATLFSGVSVWDGHSVIGPTDVLVEAPFIRSIGSAAHTSAPLGCTVISGARKLLIPGLINGHFHSSTNHLKGRFPSRPLETFMLFESPLDTVNPPTPREVYLRTALGAIEMLQSGTTAVADDAFFLPHPTPELIDAVMQAYADTGIRATVALDQPELPEVEKLPFLDALATGTPYDDRLRTRGAPAEQLLDAYDHLFSRWHDTSDNRLRAAVSVSAPQRVSLDYHRALIDLSERHRTPLYAHILETRTQRVLGHQSSRFSSASLIRYCAEHDLLTPRTDIIHAVWVDDDDMDLIAASGATVAHNPVSNLRLGSGIMPLRRMLDRGIPVALGVDEAVCNDAIDMWSVVRMAGLIHNITDADPARWPQPQEILDCLWRGGAHALGLDGSLGRIEAGALADLALVDLSGPAFTPLNDAAGQLVYCASGADVTLTMVAGRVVCADRHLTLVNQGDLLAECRELYAARAAEQEHMDSQAAQYLSIYSAMLDRARHTEVGMNRLAL
ncbi:amidohydrolase family protein [Gordonia polyisoprenivorans]|uniref:amidohydrolase family protein n=1 Tax=Gordonia polyisoprenivorans TaxID=84595 RepID=UPI001AD724CE|nr:amidohydrolase family protein [Gordonia polyisoprenivorans]QTI70535.1 amidohydrolase family protein [Gordonia polyisoprenivorans]